MPYRSRYTKIKITNQRKNEVKERHHKLVTLRHILEAYQTQAIVNGLNMDEKSDVIKYEKELGEWINEDIQDWLMLGGGEDYRLSKYLYELARALRKGGYFGMPVI